MMNEEKRMAHSAGFEPAISAPTTVNALEGRSGYECGNLFT